MDQLLARRERIAHSVQTGLKSARYDEGKMAVVEVAPEVVQTWLTDIEAAIEWARTNAVVCPLIVPENIPEVLREFLRDGPWEIFDSLIVAMQREMLLVTDDAPTRQFASRFGFDRSTWLQPAFMVAGNRNKIDFDTYVKWTAHLIGAGHNYVCVSGRALTRAASIDAEAGESPGYYFRQTARMIGGAPAEPASHIRVVIEFLRHAWNDSSALRYREKTTGFLLEQLIRERTSDYGRILRTIVRAAAGVPDLIEYLTAWLRGHFIDLAA
jgi:hypothetical protein